jgi:hypothetical protein
MLKILITAILLIEACAGLDESGVPTEKADILKLAIDNNDANIGIVAYQDTNTGQWVVMLYDGRSQSMYLGNETGVVMIT